MIILILLKIKRNLDISSFKSTTKLENKKYDVNDKAKWKGGEREQDRYDRININIEELEGNVDCTV